MRFYPSSYGTSRSATKVREYNGCHDSKSGLFAPKGTGDCEPGDWSDPGRQRAVYGQQVDDAEALNLSEDEATRAQSFIEDDLPDEGEVDHGGTKAAVKSQICGTLGKELESLPGFEAAYNAFELEIVGAPGNKPGDGGGWHGGDSYDWDDDPAGLKDAHESDYESYKEGVIEEADNAFYDEQASEYTNDKQKAVDAVAERVADLREIWNEVQEETSAYGDVSKHPKLPGLEDVSRGGARFDQKELNALVETALLDPELLAQQGWHGGYKTKDGHDWERHMDGTYRPQVDLADPERREAIKAMLRPYARSDFSKSTDEQIAADLLDKTSRFFKHGDDPYEQGFDSWRDANGGEPEYDYDSFETWYKDNYGQPPADDGDDEEGDNGFTNKSKGARMASWIVHNWAQTSGDGDTHAVMMQEAANREFKLGATYAGVFSGRGVDKHRVEANLKAHGAFLQATLRTMHTQTQKALQAAGMEYVTLYRGFGINNETKFANPNLVSITGPRQHRVKQEPGLESVNANGDFVDVLLQPMSSFSSNMNTATAFVGYSNPTLMGTRVHRSQIIGTARSGYGCLNEYEYVVLGRRQPSFIVSKESLQSDGSASRYYKSFWKAFKETQRRRAPRSPVVPGPGDRL